MAEEASQVVMIKNTQNVQKDSTMPTSKIDFIFIRRFFEPVEVFVL